MVCIDTEYSQQPINLNSDTIMPLINSIKV